MVIEFIAVPGSGKTYLSDKLYTHLKKEMSSKGIRLYNRLDINEIKKETLSNKNKNIARLNILFNYIKIINIHLFKYIIILFLSSSYSFKTKCNLSMYLLDVFFNYKIIANIKREYKNKCIFILDEGLLHASSICMTECNITNLKRFFEKLKSTKWNMNKQLYVFIDCHIDIIYNRLSERAEGWPVNWADLTSQKKQHELKKSYLKYKNKKDYIFKNEKKEKYYLIDNSKLFDNYQLFYNEINEKIKQINEN